MNEKISLFVSHHEDAYEDRPKTIMFRMVVPLWMAMAAFVLSMTSCGHAQKPTAAPPQISPPITAQNPGSASPMKGPRMMEHKFPTNEQIGNLPKGVGVPIGRKAPDALVKDAEGREVAISRYFRSGLILLVFYRGGWCPYCNFQIHELTAAYPKFQERGILPVAISVDRIEEAAKTQATYTIPFPVLSDPDLAAHSAFRVIHQADESEVARLKGFGIDLENSSGRTHHMIAIPSLFIIDRDGIARWAHADADYKVRPSTDQILQVLDGLGIKK